MSKNEYTFAVANIRGLEPALFTNAQMSQLAACKTYEECLRFLEDRGWGNAESGDDADQILSVERAKTWETVGSLGVPMDTFEVMSYPNVFHNLKTALKESLLDTKRDEFYYEGTDPDREELRQIVKDKAFDRLPAGMDTAAQEAYEALMHTRDGQLCDVIIDKACLEAISKAAEDADEIVKTYANVMVAVANIKIASRCQKTGKTVEFMLRAMTSCEGMEPEQLAKAAMSGTDSLCDYLTSCGYGDAAEALKESPSAFERWCDNYLTEMMQPQKYEVFTVGPLMAYILARENEIKTVGIILAGKRNGLPQEFITERIREMYV